MKKYFFVIILALALGCATTNPTITSPHAPPEQTEQEKNEPNEKVLSWSEFLDFLVGVLEILIWIPSK